MVKEKSDCHPSVVVAYSKDVGKFLMSVYDEGYPRKAYRLSANNIGGNPEPKDTTTENVLLREISEEFDPNHPEEKMYVGKVDWASKEDIRLVRNGLLGNVQPLQDFMVRQPEVIEGGNKPYQGVYSVFYTSINGEVIECVEKNLKDKKNIVTEGNIGVFTLGQLAKSPRGEFSTAHVTAHILNWKYKSNIPHPKQISAEPIGLPRRSYNNYTDDFVYNQEDLIKASNAED